MAHLQFTFVPVEGFVGFTGALDADAWGTIVTTNHEGPGRTASSPLGDAPALISYKLRLRWAIADLTVSLEGAASAKDCDVAWDNTQKQLRAYLDAGAASSDTQKRDAATRLQKALLIGAGEGQTRLKYQQEVDFGRKQIALMSQGQGASDVALLGLGALKHELETTTDALAVAIGHGVAQGRPFERRDAALSRCRAAFASVDDALAFLLDNGHADDRERARALRAPLETLAARYPAPPNDASTPPTPPTRDEPSDK